MTPPPASATARAPTRRPSRSVTPRTARRVSGPARTPARPERGPTTDPRGDAVAAAPLGLRLSRRVMALPDARLLDRLVRGRLWIALLAAALVGIVFLQISLLKLNTGISRAVQTSQTLERQNTELKLDLSRLAGGARIQDSAAALGFVTPASGQPRFLDARKADAVGAVAGIATPAPVRQLPLGMIPASEGGTAGVAPEPGVAAVVPEPGAAGVAPAPAVAAAVVPAPAPAAVTATAQVAP